MSLDNPGSIGMGVANESNSKTRQGFFIARKTEKAGMVTVEVRCFALKRIVQDDDMSKALQTPVVFPGVLALISFLILLIPGKSFAKVTGQCSNCHTMHNSQTDSEMATYGADGQPWKGTGPYGALLRGTCLGCHGMGTGNKIETVGGSEIPQVYHTDTEDLAAGNFAYITGGKGTGSNRKGHNVIDLGEAYQEDVLTSAPGAVHASPSNTNFTCAGSHGCHGRRIGANAGLSGSHHQNIGGKCDNPAETYNSYRFLWGTKGFENMGEYKYQNCDGSNHNEYYGTSSPGDYNVTDCNECHDMANSAIVAVDNTISGFCATCHGNFHALSQIGGSTSSPFTRHPTDVVLKNGGEYAGYTTYSVAAPIGRTTVPDSISNVVTPGTDVVTCLSCHVAHASNYPDLLRWDYTTMNAGGGGSGGCFTCHTEKN